MSLVYHRLEIDRKDFSESGSDQNSLDWFQRRCTNSALTGTSERFQPCSCLSPDFLFAQHPAHLRGQGAEGVRFRGCGEAEERGQARRQGAQREGGRQQLSKTLARSWSYVDCKVRLGLCRPLCWSPWQRTSRRSCKTCCRWRPTSTRATSTDRPPCTWLPTTASPWSCRSEVTPHG